ncbi:MAG: DUF4097 family beta strand repeat-containing protein [Acidobacteriaceae bacterium]
MGTFPPPYSREQMKAQRRILREQMRAQRYQMRAQMRYARRGSMLGPIILIGIGIVALLIQMGRIPAFYFWQWYAHWWPLLLVGAGVLLLLEWVLDQMFNHTGRPMRRGVGGGVIFLLVLLVVIGAIASGTKHINWGAVGSQMGIDNSDDWSQFFGQKHESDQTQTLTLLKGAGVSIDNPRGDVTVTGVSNDDQVHLQLHKAVYTNSDSEANRKLNDLNPQVTSSAESLAIQIPDVNSASVDMVVTMPAGASLFVKTGRGDVHVSAIQSAVAVNSSHGDVQIDGVTGAASTQMSSGDFSAHAVTGQVSVAGQMNDVTISDIDGPVNMDGDFFGDTHLEHIRGKLHFHSSRTDFDVVRLDGSLTMDSGDLTADRALGPLMLKTRSKDIELSQIAGDIHVENSNGDVALTAAPPLGTVEVDNRHGDVSLTVPEQANFGIQASTTDGEVNSDFDSLNKQSGDHGGSLNGQIGNGGSNIRLNVDKGDVSLKRAVVPPLPPLPPAAPRLSLTPPKAPATVPQVPKVLKVPKAPKADSETF